MNESVLKETFSKFKIEKDTSEVLSSLINNLTYDIIDRAIKLAHYCKSKELKIKHIEAAIKIQWGPTISKECILSAKSTVQNENHTPLFSLLYIKKLLKTYYKGKIEKKLVQYVEGAVQHVIEDIIDMATTYSKNKIVTTSNIFCAIDNDSQIKHITSRYHLVFR